MGKNSLIVKLGFWPAIMSVLMPFMMPFYAHANEYNKQPITETGGEYGSYTPSTRGGTYGVPDTMPDKGGMSFDLSTLPTQSGSYYTGDKSGNKFNNKADETQFHASGKNDAEDFFGSHVSKGMKIPTQQGGSQTDFEYKQWDGERGEEKTESFMGLDSIFQNDPQGINETKTKLAAMNNDPGEINSQTSDLVSSNPDQYLTMQEGIASSSHPDYYNDPILVRSREILSDVTAETGQVECTVEQTFINSTENKVSSDIRSCEMYNKPPDCALKRIITDVEKFDKCSIDQPTTAFSFNGYTRGGGLVDHHTIVRNVVKPVCTNFDIFSNNSSIFYLETETSRGTPHAGLIEVPVRNSADNVWRVLPDYAPHIAGGYVGRRHENTGFHEWDDQYKNYVWEYKNNVCFKDDNGNWTGDCVIEIAIRETADGYSLSNRYEGPSQEDCSRYQGDQTDMRNCRDRNSDAWEAFSRSLGYPCSYNYGIRDGINVVGMADPTNKACWGFSRRCPIDGCVDKNGIKYDTWAAAGSPGSFNYDEDKGTTIHYYRDKITYIVREDIIDEPPGCSTNDECKIHDDPNWVPIEGSVLDETSTGKWQCVDATNNYKYDDVTIDPTNPALEGIYLPTRVDGPKALFENDKEDLVCYKAKPRNRVCGPSFGGGGNGLGIIPITRYDGTIENVQVDAEYLEKAAEACELYDSDPGCALINESTILGSNDGTPILTERTYECGAQWTQVSSSVEENVSCVSETPCVGGECSQDWDENNTGFAEAAFGLSALSEGIFDNECAVEDPDLCRLFKGKSLSCKKAWGGAVDCCNNGMAVGPEAYLQAARFTNDKLIEMGLDEKAINYIKTLPGSETVTGSWEAVSTGAENVWSDVTTSVSDAIEELSQPFINFAEEYLIEKTAEDGAKGLLNYTVGDVTVLVNSFPSQVGNYLMRNFGPDVAALVMTETTPAVFEGGTMIVEAGYEFGGHLLAAANVITTAYTVYNLSMLALQAAYKCEPEEFEYERKKSGRTCTTEREYCDSEKLGQCVVKVRGACCFESVLARMLQEEAERQGVRSSFGSPPGMDCSALSITQLGNIDYSQIDPSEWMDLLTTSEILPNGADEQETTFSLENMTRNTYMTQEEIDRENDRREEDRQRQADNLTKQRNDLSDENTKISRLNSEIAQLNALIQTEMAKPSYQRNEANIQKWQNQKEDKQDDLDGARETKAAIEVRITELEDLVITSVDEDFSNQTTTAERLEQRLEFGDGNPLEELRNKYRQEMWHPSTP